MSISTNISSKDFAPNVPATDSPTQELYVIDREQQLRSFDAGRIANALKKAFLAVEGEAATNSNRINEIVERLTGQVNQYFSNQAHIMREIPLEVIQNQVEFALMIAGEHKVARAYVIYRQQREQQRQQALTTQKSTAQEIHITLPDGKKKLLEDNWLTQIVEHACDSIEQVQSETIVKDTCQNLFDGVLLKDVYKCLVMSARTLIEQEPNYTYVTANLLLHDLFNEACDFLNLEYDFTQTQTQTQTLYETCFHTYIEKGVELEFLNAELLTFDLNKLGSALNANRDRQFTYLSLQTLYDRYFQHFEGTRFELPQIFFMRVAMGLALKEENREERAIEFYNLLSSFDFMSSTPTLFNSGTTHSQLSSCYLSTVSDDLQGIYQAIQDNALLSKYAGGLGNDWTQVRALGARIKGTNGKSLGVVPFLNVADATAIAVNQGGKRKGAVCAYLETWHLDIEEFLELRKNTGDDRRRTHDMNTANWIPDLFVERVIENKDWTLFSPNETTDLHDLYGEKFRKAYEAYEKKAADGEIRSKTISAVKLWRKMLGLLFETGHPWFTFKDPCNLRSPQQHAGVIHSSNLCTEITLNTSKDEIAVCNLGSVNIPNHMQKGGLNREKLAKTVKTAIRMLDNVIDINYYAVPQASNSNIRHRPIGLGIMGFQDALYMQKIPYASEEAIIFADESMELISYYAIEASSDLAVERGCYETFAGSLWSQGILPIDSIALLRKNRGQYLQQDATQRLNWKDLRKKVKRQGMRNSNTMAIAPTATISNICGVTQSIEPTYQNLFVKSNLSGEFTVVNAHLANDLKALNLWDNVMVHDLKYYNGSVQRINRIPTHLKKIYATAFEVEPRWLIEAASRRQKWLDQSQSLNLYIAKPSGKKLDGIYRAAWLSGLKTTYYLRSLAATGAEKATISDGALNAVSINTNPKACSIDDPDCEACQ